MNRRNFIVMNFFAIAAYLIEACTGSRSTITETGEMFSLSDYPMLQNIGGIAEIRHQNNPFMAVRVSEETISVVSQKCSHRGCILFTQANGMGLECPCHGSSFDLKGGVTRGPAQRSLEKLTVNFNTATGFFKVS